MKVCVIIPALNEAGNIGDVVKQTLAQAVHQVIVVDNGSTDDTASVAERAGATVIRESRRGYGRACAAGVAAAEADVIAFLDGDFNFSPSELSTVVSPILIGSADLVMGSRVLGHIEKGAMPMQQRFGNWLGAKLLRRLYGLHVTDLGPYRAIRRDLLLSLNMGEMTYGWHSEMTVKAARRKVRIVEVPVSFHIRRTGLSKVSGTLRGTLLAGYYILGVTFRYAF
jgi:glycosyltransferase involved in cell wall biosynthesis